MKWTLGLLLLVAAGCGYRETRMVACPDTGCGHTYAATASPEGTVAPREPAVRPAPLPAPEPLPEPAPVP